MPRTDALIAPPSSSSCSVASRISSSVRARRGPGRPRLLGAVMSGRLLCLTSSWTAYSICTSYKICTASRDRPGMSESRDPYPVHVDASLDPSTSRGLWLVKVAAADPALRGAGVAVGGFPGGQRGRVLRDSGDRPLSPAAVRVQRRRAALDLAGALLRLT